MIQKIIVGRGCGKSLKAAHSMNMNPEEYKKYCENFNSQLNEEIKKRRKQEHAINVLLWRSYFDY